MLVLALVKMLSLVRGTLYEHKFSEQCKEGCQHDLVHLPHMCLHQLPVSLQSCRAVEHSSHIHTCHQNTPHSPSQPYCSKAIGLGVHKAIPHGDR